MKNSFDIWTKHLPNKNSLFKEVSAYAQLECIKSCEYKSEVSVLKRDKKEKANNKKAPFTYH